MGVPGLWPILGQAGSLHNLETLDLAAVTDDAASHDHRLPIVGVDISAWLYHARLSVEGSNPMLRLIFFRLARLLSLPISVVFVFDGPLRPRIKRGRTVGAGKHPLTGPLMEMIAAFGGVGWEAPGEAEAELSRMNREGLVDAVLSDDVDSLVFGARAIMRNWSATLSGSKSAAAPSSDEHGDNSVTIYKASHIADIPDLNLDQDGLILVAILAGGDYDLGGLGGCGAKTAAALATGGYGAPLIAGFKEHCKITGHDPMTNLPIVTPSASWSAFLDSWRDTVREELSTNKQKLMNRKERKLAESDEFNALLSTSEALQVLASYVEPVTTWSVAEAGAVASTSRPASRPPRRLKFKEPNMTAVATFAQRTFAWGPKATVGRMRNVIWKGLLVREMRRLQLAEHPQPQGTDGTPRYPFTTIHSERRHPATGNLLEYRVEWDPTPLAKSAQAGIDPLLNVGPGFDEPYPDDYSLAPGQLGNAPATSTGRIRSSLSNAGSDSDSSDEDERPPRSPYELILASGDGQEPPPSPTKRKPRPPPDPFSSVRSWVLAERLELCSAGRALIKAYKDRLANKGKRRTVSALPRSKNQPAIDGIFSVQKSALTKTQSAGKTDLPTRATSVAPTGMSPPRQYRQTHLSFGEPSTSRAFGRTQSGPAAAPSSSATSMPDTENILPFLPPRRERASSFDTVLEESFQMMSDSESEGGDDKETGDGFAHLRAANQSIQPLVISSQTASSRSPSPPPRAHPPVQPRTRPLRQSATAAQMQAPLQKSGRRPPAATTTSTSTSIATKRTSTNLLLSSSPPDLATSDPDDSLPNMSDFLRTIQRRLEKRTDTDAGNSTEVAPTTARRGPVRTRVLRSSSGSSDTSSLATPVIRGAEKAVSPVQMSPSPRRPSSSKRAKQAGGQGASSTRKGGAGLPFLSTGKAASTHALRGSRAPGKTLKGPPAMHPSSASTPPPPAQTAAIVDLSSSPPSSCGTIFTSGAPMRRKGARKSDAIVLSDSD